MRLTLVYKCICPRGNQEKATFRRIILSMPERADYIRFAYQTLTMHIPQMDKKIDPDPSTNMHNNK
jgi:hypothetical protein